MEERRGTAVFKQALKVNQLDISLSIQINRSLPWHL